MANFIPSRAFMLRSTTSIWPISAAVSWYQGVTPDERPRFDRQTTAVREKRPIDPDALRKKFADYYFTFGPNNSFYYRGPKGARWSMPVQHIKEFVDDPDATVEWIVWNRDDLYAKHAKDDDLETSYRFTNAAIQSNMPKLCSYLDAYRKDEPYVVLGPNKSYVLWCRDSQRWAYLVDKKAYDEMQSLLNKGKVSLVALGCSSSYYVKYEDGSAAWDLKGQYPSLAIALDAIELAGEHEVQFLAMDPTKPHGYFLLLSNDSVRFHLDASIKDRIKKAIERDGLSIKSENY